MGTYNLKRKLFSSIYYEEKLFHLFNGVSVSDAQVKAVMQLNPKLNYKQAMAEAAGRITGAENTRATARRVNKEVAKENPNFFKSGEGDISKKLGESYNRAYEQETLAQQKLNEMNSIAHPGRSAQEASQQAANNAASKSGGFFNKATRLLTGKSKYGTKGAIAGWGGLALTAAGTTLGINALRDKNKTSNEDVV